jgi:hypothetical protein
MWEFGAEFDKLTDAQQHDLQRHCRVGTHLIVYFPGELEAAEAFVKADVLMRLLLPPRAVVYQLGWHWLPQCRLGTGWSLFHKTVTSVIDHLTAQSVDVHQGAQAVRWLHLGGCNHNCYRTGR